MSLESQGRLLGFARLSHTVWSYKIVASQLSSFELPRDHRPSRATFVCPNTDQDGTVSERSTQKSAPSALLSVHGTQKVA